MTWQETVKLGLTVVGAYTVGSWVADRLGPGKTSTPEGLFDWKPPEGDLVLVEADEGDQEEGIPHYINDQRGRGYGDVVERSSGRLEVVMGYPEGYQGETSRIVEDEDEALEAAQEIVDQIMVDEGYTDEK